MATTTTPNLGLTLAVPGSNEPFDTAVVNANFEAIDDEVGSQRADSASTDTRLDTIEKFTNPSVASPTLGVVPAGTTAQRDGYYGAPGTAAARVALAAKGARWFNTDKGWEEQYFAATADAGAGRFSKQAAGWGPAAHLGLVPIRPSSVANTGGTSALHGARGLFTGVTQAHVNGVFTTDFTEYQVRVRRTSATGTVDLLLRKRNAGTTDASGTYSASVVYQAGAGSAVINQNANGSGMVIGGGNGADGSYSVVNVNDPAGAGKTAIVMQAYDTRPTMMAGGGSAPAGAHDGFTVLASDSSTISLEVLVFGVNNY